MIELEDWSDKKVYAEYSSFRLESESEFYRLRLGTYQGNAGDSMMWHNGKQFTTLDRDKDMYTGKTTKQTWLCNHHLLCIKYVLYVSQISERLFWIQSKGI